jgi:ribosomal-protein-alanine N-acetyltransferase
LEIDGIRNWAIRKDGGALMGGVGVAGVSRNEKAEIGYWLARSHWGRGIMTDAVRRLCEFAFEEYNLQRIHAQAFTTNPASSRVLEKAGFTLEGTLRKGFFRDGQAYDVRCYGLLRAGETRS